MYDASRHPNPFGRKEESTTKHPYKRAVFFDIDGTLWDRSNHIPESAIEAIHLLQSRGHLAFLNSGRSRGYIFEETLLGIGFDGIISGCGCMIEYQGETLYQYTLPEEEAQRAVDILRRFGLWPILEGHERLYLDPCFLETDYGKKLHRDLGKRLGFIEEHRGHWGLCKFSCLLPAGSDLGSCISALAPRYYPMVHGTHLVEFAPVGHTKATGLARILSHAGLSPEQSIAFGDSANDLEMIQAAGIGVAMGNGQEELKKEADLICPPMAEDGIYRALLELGLL